MSVRNRVTGGRPEGGQYAAIAHSDTVPSLSPAASRRQSIAALRARQLTWKDLQDSLEAQRAEVDSKVRDAATAFAAIDMLEVLPQVAKLSYRRDGNEIVFISAADSDGETIVSDSELWDPDNPWAKDRTFQAAVRRTEENLEASGLDDRWLDIDVNDAIAKAAARLDTAGA
ncbi:MAG TPA: hypothetical protein VF867_05980 [Arthrobacter sp.]